MSLLDNLKFITMNDGIYNFVSADVIYDYKNIINIIFNKDLVENNRIVIDNYLGYVRTVKASKIGELEQKAISHVKYLGQIQKLNTKFLESLETNSFIIDFNSDLISNYNELYEIVKANKHTYLLLSSKNIESIYVKNFKINLPDKKELISIIEKYFKDNNISINKMIIEQITNYVSGIPITKLNDILSYSIYQFKENRKDFFKTLLEEKKNYFKLNLSIEFIEEVEKISNLGGQNALKAWLKEREKSLSLEAEKLGIPFPKGLLLVGIQGCGKSLTAKSISSMWKMPLLKMDFSLLFTTDKTPEVTFKENLMMAEKLSPIILWLDEIDKLFSASSSSGVIELKRILGTFLTWLQEKTSKVFVVATANKIDDIPPELLRKGRFDEIFFLDLPKEKERNEIFKIHLKKRNLDFKKFNIEEFTKRSDFFSGSEIEQVIVSALYRGFYLNRPITDEDFYNIIEDTIPFYNTYEESIKELKKWAEEKARKASFDDEVYEMFE